MTEKITFDFETPEDNLGYLLWQTTMQWQRKMNRSLAEVGLTHTQFVVLIALAWLTQDTKQVTQKDISEHSHIDRMMVSKILRNLERSNLVQRQEHPTDTRAKSVFLTSSGRMTLQRAIAIKTNANDNFFRQLKDPQSFALFLRQLVNLS